MDTAVKKIDPNLPMRQVSTVMELLDNNEAKRRLAGVAASHLNPERLMRIVAGAMRATPDLGKADPMTLLGAVMTCAQVGLEPNTVLGHAYLIPFRNGRKSEAQKRDVYEVQVIIGYKGYIDLARRSGHITSIDAGVHYSDDELWDYERGTDARLRHVPGPLNGEKLHAYAIAKFKDGGHAFTVLPWTQVMKVRDGSQGYQQARRKAERYKQPINTPWVTHEDAMAAKTAIRALVKFLPLSIEFQNALAIDEQQRDFARFAADPLSLDPSGDDDDGQTIEGEATEGDGDAPAVEQETPAEETKPAEATPGPNGAVALADAKAKAKAAVAANKAPEQKPEPKQPPEEGDLPTFDPLVQQFRNDLAGWGKSDTAVAELLEMWAPHFEKIEARNPALHAALLREVDEHQAAPSEED